MKKKTNLFFAATKSIKTQNHKDKTGLLQKNAFDPFSAVEPQKSDQLASIPEFFFHKGNIYFMSMGYVGRF